jgi:hypothetical protein
MIRHVRQEHACGCAIAAIAMVTGLPYAEVLGRLGPDIERLVTRENGGMWNLATFVALQRLGYAVALETRGEWGRKRDEWTPAPISEVNIAEVLSPVGAHMIVVFPDGKVLDPATDAAPRRLSDYYVYWIAGVVPLARTEEV